VSKQRKAQALTAAALFAVLAVVLARQGAVKLPAISTPGLAPAKQEASPQDAIYRMFDAAREGKVSEYLAMHTGKMETALRAAIQEQTEAGFASYLRQTNAPVKGLALQDPEQLTDREVRVRVEYVYEDRNEVQQIYLEKTAGQWKISRVDAAERIKTIVPYGTPVQ
jgi:hypothetical protein